MAETHPASSPLITHDAAAACVVEHGIAIDESLKRCSSTSTYRLHKPRAEARLAPETLAVANLAWPLPTVPLEFPNITIDPWNYPTTVIEARLISPSAGELLLAHLPSRLHANRPLEIEVAACEPSTGDNAEAASVARWIFTHARISITVDLIGRTRVFNSLPLSARLSGGGWIVRALLHPAPWVDASSVSVVSLTQAGRPLPRDSLPATLRVGYNHAPAIAGAVFAATLADDLPALQAALDAAGSTEEADEVREETLGAVRSSLAPTRTPNPTHTGSTAALPNTGPPPEANLRPFARSWRQAPTRPQQTM